MSDPNAGSTGAVQGQEASSAATGAAAVQGAPAAAAGKSANYTAATQVGSMAALKEKVPELYDKMLQGIAQTICNRMQDGQRRLKEAMRRNRQH